jgi:DNA primase
VYDTRAILDYVDPLYTINQQLMEYFQLQLTLGDDVGELDTYLQQRGFSPEMLELFRVGYCPVGSAVYEFAVGRGWSEEQLQAVGFWKLSDDQQSVLLKFDKRLMFPFSDVDGTVYGFSGRVIHNEKVPNKYVNTSNCDTFNKSIAVYGLREALLCNTQIDRWVLVEGNADVLSLFQVGVSTAVAAAGTAVTELHLMRLARYCKRFVLMLDNDDAGKKATSNLLQSMKDLHLSYQISILKEVKDPDEAVRTGRPDIIYRALNMKV